MNRRTTILVTGASTGIGRHLAERFARRGHRVLATARRERDLGELAAIGGVEAVALDVRDAEDAARLPEIVGDALDGLVNNAAVGDLGPLAAFTDEELRDLFEVNVIGVHRMTNACLAALLQARGRVVNIGSQGGSITKAHFGPYTMTKHALEAYTSALDDELRPHGARAVIVQPGAVATAMGANALPSTKARLERARAPFDVAARAMLAQLQNEAPPDPSAPESDANRRPSPPSLVGDAVEHALFAAVPRRRYLVGTRWEGDRVIEGLLDRLADANASPGMQYDAAELAARLARQLERERPLW